jgi:hypothetical protein
LKNIIFSLENNSSAESSKHSSMVFKYLWLELKISPLGIYPKDCDTGYSRGICTPMFIAALFTIAKLWKQPRCPTTDEWIKKMWYLYTVNYFFKPFGSSLSLPSLTVLNKSPFSLTKF